MSRRTRNSSSSPPQSPDLTKSKRSRIVIENTPPEERPGDREEAETLFDTEDEEDDVPLRDRIFPLNTGKGSSSSSNPTVPASISSSKQSSSSTNSSNSSSSSSAKETSSSLSSNTDNTPVIRAPSTRLSTSSRKKTPGSNGSDIPLAVATKWLQDYSSFVAYINRKTFANPRVIDGVQRVDECQVHVGIGEEVSKNIANCAPYHLRLEYMKAHILGDDGVTYDIDPVVSVIVCLQLHICARDGFNAENVYNRAINYLTTPGFFVSRNQEWADKAFMSHSLSRCIDNDEMLRKVLPRVCENWKQKLRIKSGPFISSLKTLRPDFHFPDQETGIILRQVAIQY